MTLIQTEEVGGETLEVRFPPNSNIRIHLQSNAKIRGMLHVLKQRNETHSLRVKAGHTTDTRLDFLPLVSCPVLDVRDI